MIEKEFAELLDGWWTDVKIQSVFGQMLTHPSYARLLEYGDVGIAGTLAKLAKERSVPLALLLSRMEPSARPFAANESGGRMMYETEAVVEAWLAWGRKRGYAC